jgi:hypothetical protein
VCREVPLPCGRNGAVQPLRPPICGFSPDFYGKRVFSLTGSRPADRCLRLGRGGLRRKGDQDIRMRKGFLWTI